jgi:hypothetical protein
VGFSPLTALHGLIEENEEPVPDRDLTNDDAPVSYSHSHGEVNLDSVKSIDIKSGLAVRKLSEADYVRKLADLHHKSHRVSELCHGHRMRAPQEPRTTQFISSVIILSLRDWKLQVRSLDSNTIAVHRIIHSLIISLGRQNVGAGLAHWYAMHTLYGGVRGSTHRVRFSSGFQRLFVRPHH